MELNIVLIMCYVLFVCVSLLIYDVHALKREIKYHKQIIDRLIDKVNKKEDKPC